MQEKKPWYKSKITLLGLLMGFFGLTLVATKFFGTQLTPEQIDAVQSAFPETVERIRRAIQAQDYFAILSAAAGFVTAIWRVWFTDKKILAA